MKEYSNEFLSGFEKGVEITCKMFNTVISKQLKDLLDTLGDL